MQSRQFDTPTVKALKNKKRKSLAASYVPPIPWCIMARLRNMGGSSYFVYAAILTSYRIQGTGPILMKLRNELNIPPSNLSRIVSRLEAEGLIRVSRACGRLNHYAIVENEETADVTNTQ